MKIPRFLKTLGVLGITASASIGAPQLPPVKKSEEDESRRAFEDSDIIGASDWKTQGNYLPLRSLDEHIHRYSKLEEMVSTVVWNGRFWTKVRFANEGNGFIALHGLRNDEQKFCVRREFTQEGNEDFDLLCRQLDNCLKLDKDK